MSHRFTSLLTHLIFSTKERFPFLDRELSPECYAYLGGIVERLGGRRIVVGGETDHVHLLLDLPATLSLSDCLRTLKSNSSKWIHGKGPERSKFAWQQGYAAVSVSKSGVDGVVRYIEQQHEHHRRVTYQEEVRRFLAEHGMACDERYMWE
jgi:REP-associated tyrosine transposase